MEHLIADSGIHFITQEVSFTPSEPLRVGQQLLKYYFAETTDDITGTRTFSLLYHDADKGVLIPLDELMSSGVAVLRPSGREDVDEIGVIKMVPDADTTFLTTFSENDPAVYSFTSLLAYRVSDPHNNNSRANLPAFELLLDHWLPLPMYHEESDGVTSDKPMAWCRMKMSRLSRDNAGRETFRLVFAFDTQQGDDAYDTMRPFIAPYDAGKCVYKMCNKVDLLLDFLSSSEDFHAFSDYIASLLGVDLQYDTSRKYKAYYIYFLNYLRLVGCCPEVTLHANPSSPINVDLVLDIGNSRTCGILFQEGAFTQSSMLELHDLTCPATVYDKSFDMRLVFRRADFGNAIILDEEMFQWRSFVRVGEEARRLIYDSIDDDGLAARTTNYSSPKRYLWDKKKYTGKWENLVITGDPANTADTAAIAVPGLSALFANDGSYAPSADGAPLVDFGHSADHYSRSSLMTFAFIEIFQHALMQINSVSYRNKWGNIDVRRTLRNIIITCPPAMPLDEQVFLRQSATDAYAALRQCSPHLPAALITPSPAALQVTDPYAPLDQKVWKYDEASCCQLVYLYAEIAQRYGGEIQTFFDMKGHSVVSPDGTSTPTLTIGTIDIGAGTTDLMVCSYTLDAKSRRTITPTPLFYDSFYLAGDDILRNIVQNVIIEGKNLGQREIGNISSALTAYICGLSDAELQALPCLNGNNVYSNIVKNICLTTDKDDKHRQQVAFAANLLHDFFGTDSSMMGFRDRQHRNDFNTQISVPLAQKFLDLLRIHRPSKLYSFDELFDIRPAQHLLDAFAQHFGFRFEDLSWRYNPSEIASIVQATLESLLKQLALVLYTQKCDVVVLAGRPTSLDAITELFIKYFPVSPDRLVRLNDYRVGNWFPTADGQGYFYDHKAIVAVGAMIGFLAGQGRLKDLTIDFSQMITSMTSTANYIGEYNVRQRQVSTALLSPTAGTAEFTTSSFPLFLGCRQLCSSTYQARPLYAIYNNSTSPTLTLHFSRDFAASKEHLVVEDAYDSDYNNKKNDVEVVCQSIADDGNHWLDKGEFELTIK